MAKQLNPTTVFKQVRDKFNVSMAGGILEKSNKPTAQPAPPSVEDMEKGIELLQLQKLNSSKRDVTLKKTNNPDLPEVLVLSLSDRPSLERKRVPFGDPIWMSIKGTFKYFSTRQNREAYRI